jgi:hypothetical protein
LGAYGPNSAAVPRHLIKSTDHLCPIPLDLRPILMATDLSEKNFFISELAYAWTERLDGTAFEGVWPPTAPTTNNPAPRNPSVAR